MAQKSRYNKNTPKGTSPAYPHLPFHSPSFTQTEKTELVARLSKGDIRMEHFREVLSENDWLKVRYDHDNGVWLVVHTFTPNDSDTPIGIVSYRAKKLENVLAMAIWKAGELSASLFESEPDDDF